MKCYLLVDQTVDTQQPTPRISPFYAVFRVSICPADFDSGWRLVQKFPQILYFRGLRGFSFESNLVYLGIPVGYH